MREHPAGQGHRATSPCWIPRASCTPAATTSTRSRPNWPSAPIPRGLHRRHRRGARRRRRVPGRVGRSGAGGAHRDDGARRHRVRDVESRSRDPPRRRHASTRRWWPPGAATSRTRSTTCWRSPACSAGRWTPGARRITEKMKVAAAEAIFSVVGDDLAVDHIVPSALDPRVGPAVAAAVAAASQGVSRLSRRRFGPLAAAGVRWWLLACWPAVAARRRRRRSPVGAHARSGVGADRPPLRGGVAVLRQPRARRRPAEIPLGRLDSGEVQVAPGFTGRLLQPVRARTRRRARMSRSTAHWSRRCPRASPAGDYTTSAEDKPAVAVTETTADEWGGRDVSAMARQCADVDGRRGRSVSHPATVGTCKLPRPANSPTTQRCSPRCAPVRSTPRGRRPRHRTCRRRSWCCRTARR